MICTLRIYNGGVIVLTLNDYSQSYVFPVCTEAFPIASRVKEHCILPPCPTTFKFLLVLTKKLALFLLAGVFPKF